MEIAQPPSVPRFLRQQSDREQPPDDRVLRPHREWYEVEVEKLGHKFAIRLSGHKHVHRVQVHVKETGLVTEPEDLAQMG